MRDRGGAAHVGIMSQKSSHAFRWVGFAESPSGVKGDASAGSSETT